MRVESFNRQKDKKDRFTVLFDDGTKTTVGAAQIADFGIFIGRELSEEEYEELRLSSELGSAKARALRILGNRNLSAKEMQRRLIEKGESVETSTETVRWLESSGLISDEDYAAKIVRHYCEKGYGLARIKDELHRRGIQRDFWDAALEEINGMEDISYALLEKKLRGSRDKAELHRASEFLVRRGYSYEQARAAINKYIKTQDKET